MPTLNWIGKEKIVNHHNDVVFRTLEKKYSYGEENSGNMIIHGDNLEALKALLPKYEGRIKCIYIDPPYNTGNENWVYNDNVNDPRIKKWLGEVVGKESDDLSRHDKWLCMMYPRLVLLQRLLSEDGAIFISIDDNEQANLKLICDEIFGSNNFLCQFVWQKRTSPDARKKISTGHEYIILYTRNRTIAEDLINSLQLDEQDIKSYSNPDNDPKGPWRSTDFGAQGYRPNQMYTIVTPAGIEYKPSDGRCWKNIESVYTQLLSDGRMWFGLDGKGVPRKKVYLFEKNGKNVWTWWSNTEVGHNQEATQLIVSIFGTKTVFDYPKPVRLIERILQLITQPNSIILDSFAGSGTTAHAVLNLNKQDGGNRKFILCEMCDYAENVTAERVRRVMKGYGEGKNKVEGTGGGFDFYELGDTIFDSKSGLLNDDAPLENIREYVWFTETNIPYNKPEDTRNEYLLGRKGEVDYYLYYKQGEETTLNWDFLRSIRRKAEQYIIYADRCLLDAEEMQKHNIVYKKIPRDIKRV